MSLSIAKFSSMSLSISIFSRMPLSISIFSKSVCISTIYMVYRYIEHPQGVSKVDISNDDNCSYDDNDSDDDNGDDNDNYLIGITFILMPLMKVENSTSDDDDCNHDGVFSDTDCLKVHSLRVLGCVHAFSQTEAQALPRFSPLLDQFGLADDARGLPGSNAHLVACVARQADILEHVVFTLQIPLIFANIFDRCALHTGGA